MTTQSQNLIPTSRSLVRPSSPLVTINDRADTMYTLMDQGYDFLDSFELDNQCLKQQINNLPFGKTKLSKLGELMRNIGTNKCIRLSHNYGSIMEGFDSETMGSNLSQDQNLSEEQDLSYNQIDDPDQQDIIHMMRIRERELESEKDSLTNTMILILGLCLVILVIIVYRLYVSHRSP
jgi:hypothetical protein